MLQSISTPVWHQKTKLAYSWIRSSDRPQMRQEMEKVIILVPSNQTFLQYQIGQQTATHSYTHTHTLQSIITLLSLYYSDQNHDHFVGAECAAMYWCNVSENSCTVQVRHNQTVLDKQEAFIFKWKTKPLFHSLWSWLCTIKYLKCTISI